MMHRSHLHALSLVLALAVVFSDIQPGYLDFDNLPETNFSCEGKVIGGYYADVETGCQMFHVCTIGQKGEISDIKFLCLNGTVFDQETRVCERIDEVDCDKSEDFFNLNLELYGNTANFGAQDCDEDCEEDEEEEEEEDEDAEYDDDTETTTIVTTTTTQRTTTTTTTRPTTQRTTHAPTQPRTQSYTRFTTQQPDSIAALLALHNAFNQGLNRRPTVNPVSSTRLPSITSTSTRRPTSGATLRTRFGSHDHQHRHDQGYLLRPRPTFQPTFTSSLQTPLKSNYHTFESGDTHFAHSFDPDKPYHFQYFAQKSSPSPFTVRIEPEVSVVTSTSTSTSIRIANTTVDENPYEDYDGYDSFFHDVQKITRPKRSTTQRSSSRILKTPPDLNIDNFFNKRLPTQKLTSDTSSDHVIKIDQSDVLLAKNYTSESTEPKAEYLNNLLDSIAMEDTERKQVLELIRESEPEMEKLINSKGVNLMLETLENKLLEMELEGQGSGFAFEYEGDSLEVREKRGSDNKGSVGNVEQPVEQSVVQPGEGSSEEVSCKNPEFCVESSKDEVVKVEIESRKKRSASSRVTTVDKDSGETEGRLDDDDEYLERRGTTETPKKSRRKGPRPTQARSVSRQSKRAELATERNKSRSSPRRNNVNRSKSTTTKQPDVKPVTEEIENDITTAEYRRSPIPFNGETRKRPFSEHTTPYSIPSSTRLQTRFEYKNQKTTLTTKRTTLKPTYYRQVPVYEEDDYTEIVELEKNKSHKVHRRSPIIVYDKPPIRTERLAQFEIEPEEISYDSVPIQRTRLRTSTRARSQSPARLDPEYTPSHGGDRRLNERTNQSPSRTRNFEEETNRRVPIRSRTSQRTGASATTEKEESIFKPRTPQEGRSSSRARVPSRDSSLRGTTQRVEDRDHGSISASRHNDANLRLHSIPGGSEIQHSNGNRNDQPLKTDFTPTTHQHVPDSKHDLFQETFPGVIDPNTYEASVAKPALNSRTTNVDVQSRTVSNHNVQQTGSRRTVVRTRNRLPDGTVLPEDTLYSTPRPGTNSVRPSSRLHGSQNVSPLSRSEEAEIPTSTTTVPSTPYTPGPDIEADPNFSCRGRVKGGLYADVHADCHGFFICSQAKRGIVPTHFWCGVGTRFNQKSRTCQAASLVDCSDAPRLYYLNNNQYNPSIDIEEKLRGSFEPMKV